MAFLNIEIGDVVLAKLLANAVAKGESLDAYIERVLAQDSPGSDADVGGLTLEQALELALMKVEKLEPGTSFMLQDLLADEWGRVASPRWLGRRFRAEVELAGCAKFVSKTQTNKAIYRRL